jgi:hypothetical protein
VRLLLGSAEIRVFSNEGRIYAAPNLLFHYVCEHHYRPPKEFVQALRTGPRPPSQAYFDALMRRNLTWGETPRSFG